MTTASLGLWAETGVCTGCNSASRICNAWSVIEGQMVEGRIHVKLVGREPGLLRRCFEEDERAADERCPPC